MDTVNTNKPKIRSFEDLYCWQCARELTNEIYRLTGDKNKFTDWSLANQAQRATVSIMSNLAEGFERGTREEQIYFCYIAKGSAAEVRCQLYIMRDQGLISTEDLERLTNLSKKTSAAIYRYIESLKVSQYKGLKYRTDADREKEKGQRDLEQMLVEKGGMKRLPDGSLVSPVVYERIMKN
ncbi:MAG: 30S ribosomal protein S23 [Candidatus Berkelbacteria bacterium Licking1014_2]|uniref:30S ribosomal protein S23 n=1 Tax=Candidatus Berkelbacteria bacterium Licking1014_2 TaxID=2017146 RepID=A0A554LX11_9BACT|nr:MAG: 30S ribosomal protein S23 [Candidatus Berkelbacteria bacterium Licking1014_2]